MQNQRERAVIFMDVVEYTRLMSTDEAGTHARFNQLKDEVVTPIASEYSGEIRRLLGDSILIEFAEAKDAVSFAVSFQNHITQQIGNSTSKSEMRFRVGGNVGPVFEDEQGAIGTSVNIAARLQDIAPVGGICITEQMLDAVSGEAAENFEFAGNQQLKNIPAPVSVWNWKWAVGSSDHLISKPKEVNKQPGVAVFPFEYFAADEQHRYLVDGLAEEIITRLSYSPVLRVTARNSSFVYKDTPRDIAKIADILDIAYFMEGSVRVIGNKIKANLQLGSVETGEQVWASSYNENIELIHDFLEKVVEDIARAVDPAITKQELHKAVRKAPQNMGAWDHFLQGKSALNRYTRSQNVVAQEHFQQSIKLENDFALTHAYLSRSYFADAYLGWKEDRENCFKMAYKAASNAIEVDENEVQGHVELVAPGLMTGHYERAFASGHRAVELNPYSSDAHFNCGLAELYFGDLKEAQTFLNNARAYNPANPVIWLINTALGLSHYCDGDYEQTIRLAKLSGEAPHGMVSSSFLTAIAEAQLGAMDMAEEAAINLRKLTSEQKNNLLSNMPFSDEKRLAHIVEGLEKANW